MAGQWVYFQRAPEGDSPALSEFAVPVFASAVLSFVGLCLLGYERVSLGSIGQDLRHCLRHHPRKLAVGMGVSLVMLILVGAEVGLYIANHTKSAKTRAATSMGSYPRDFYHNDELLGYAATPNKRTAWAKKVYGNVAYDVVYTIDASSRRVTPSSAGEDAKDAAMFFGGSFTFGEGVNDDETMPHYFGERAGDMAIYNCASGGYGPQQMLAQLESGRLDDLLAGRSVIGVYMFIDNHLQRAIGSMHVVTSWGGNMPCYELDDDEPVLLGSFRRGRPWETSLQKLCSKSQILRYFRVDVPPLWLDSHVHLTARIIEKSADLLAEKSAESRFYMLFYPGSNLPERLGKEFEGSRVEVLDYSSLIDRWDKTYRMAYDSHPTPAAHEAVAAQLAKDILGASPSRPDSQPVSVSD
jgi:hypothetical protein